MRIAMVGPSCAVKTRIVLESLLERGFVDANHLLVLSDSAAEDTPLAELCRRAGVAYRAVSDPGLQRDVDVLQSFAADFLVSCGWAQKIHADVLDVPAVAALNCHSSFLPDYKGGSVYRHYWANCEPWTGATVHFMTEKFDAGNILAQQRIRVFDWDTPQTLLWRVSELTACLLCEAVLLASQGSKGRPQSGGRYFYPVSRWRLRAHRLYNRWISRLGFSRWLTPHKVIKCSTA